MPGGRVRAAGIPAGGCALAGNGGIPRLTAPQAAVYNLKKFETVQAFCQPPKTAAGEAIRRKFFAKRTNGELLSNRASSGFAK
jgi:hypothetical protein